MKMQAIIIFTVLLYSVNSFSQERLMKTHKVVFYNYNEFNSRITKIFSSDTLVIKMSNESDSVYYYQSMGYFNIELQVNTKLKTAKYENGFYDGDVSNEASIKEIRNAFEVKYIDNKNFRYGDKNFLVYKILVTNKKIEECAALVYWSKDLGIIMQKDLYVNGLIRFDYVDDETKNNIVHHLCYFVYSDSKFNYLNDWEEYLK